MNMKMKQTSASQRVIAGLLTAMMVLTSFAGIGGTMAVDTSNGDGIAVDAIGGVSVQTFTQDFLSNELEGDATLLGAEFTVYDADGKGYCVITTDETGFATTGAVALPAGVYTIRETKAPEGYKLNEVWEKTFAISELGEIVALTGGYVWTDAFDFTSNDVNDARGLAHEVIRGGLRIYVSTKDRSETDTTDDDMLGEGDADLAGAEFVIVNASAGSVTVNGQKFQSGKVVMTITSDENGIAETGAYDLPYGRYEVYQIESPDGLYIDSRFVTTVEVREDGCITDGNSYDGSPVQQSIYRGGFEMQKIDAILNSANVQGDATLEGAVFNVINESTHDVYVGGKWYATGEVCATVTTDASGYVKTSNLLLPYGTYRITEQTASAGYQVNAEFSLTFQIREDGKIYDLTGTAFPEYVITGDVQIIKTDIELGKSEAIGGNNHDTTDDGTSLSGIVYAIRNMSKTAVVVGGKTYAPGAIVTTVTSHWNDVVKAYTAETVNGLLPYGTYTIEEIITNESYKLTDNTVYTFEIREQGAVVTKDIDDEDMIYANQVIRGDIMFEIVEGYTYDRLPTLWILTNVSTGERHVLAADRNGEYLSNSEFGFAHSKNTNANDKLLSKIDAGEVIAMSEVIQGTGTWFGLGEDGTMASVDDALAALPYGKYVLQEVATDSNAEYHRELKSFEFYVYRDNTVIDLGTIMNDHAAPTVSLSGSAIDDTTGSQIGIAGDNVTIIDTVSYDNLTAGYTYRVVGTLYSKTTGSMLAVPDGNGGYTAVVEEYEFTATQSSGEFDMVFTFDGSEIAGDSVIIGLSLIDVYENTKGESVENKIMESHDMNNSKQTVVYPAVDTELVVDMTKGHDAPAVSEMVVTDTIYYTNLIPGRNYTVNGVLVDAATGNDAVDANGNDIHATATFTANEADGFVTLTFKFDASEMTGKTLVAYEEILYRGVAVAQHADITDVKQTISFPEIDTKASCEATANNEGVVGERVVIEDIVYFKGLVVGERYAIDGKLIDKATGEELPYGAAYLWTASTTEGYVTLRFVIDSAELAGKDVVVYEYLSRDSIALTEHADIDDADQTVSFPSIDTSVSYADSGIREGAVNENTVLVDTVTYANLVPGVAYKLTGTLMDKASGAVALDADGNVITAEAVFIPDSADGTVEVRFEFDSRNLAGDTIVVFETLSRDGVSLISHNHIDDADQTIRFAAIDTNLGEKETGADEIGAIDSVKLVDAVYYSNLVPGVEYEIETRVMDKSTGLILDGFDAIVTKFTPETADGVIEIEIELNAAELSGKALVAFETISRDGNIIIAHADINDADQTVTVSSLLSNAVLSENGALDTIQYTNLQVGRMYTLTGVAMDSNGKMLDKIVATFIPKSAVGVMKIELKFDADAYAGEDITIIDTLVGQMGNVLGEDSTVLSIPAKETEPSESETEPSEPEDVHTHDHVVGGIVAPTCTEAGYTVYECECGDRYTVPTESATGHQWSEWEVTTEATTDVEGVETRHCEVDGCDATETRAIDKLPEETQPDTEPSVPETTEPEVTDPSEPEETEPSDKPHEHNYEVFRIVEPTCIAPGCTMYRCSGCGSIYSVNDVSAKGHQWSEWEVTVEATVDNDGTEIRHCTVEDCNTTQIRRISRLPVVGEDESGESVTTPDEDEAVTGPDDEGEVSTPEIDENAPHVTVTVISIQTTGAVLEVGEVEIKAVVKYDNLTVGETYSVEAKLIDHDTGAVVRDVNGNQMIVKQSFVADSTSGTLELVFNVINTSKVPGKTYDVVTTISWHETPVIENTEEVYVADLDTVATSASGTKYLILGKDVILIDNVEYFNLVPGETYYIEGKVLNAKTGELVLGASGKDPVVKMSFVPTEANGALQMKFNLDTSNANGETYVVVQTLYDMNGNVLALHDILSDADQSVTVKTVANVQTGVYENSGVIAGIAIVTLLAGVVFVVLSRKRRCINW